MLSSTPLCFSLFGHLAAFPETAARVLDASLPWDVEAIEKIELEHAPPDAARRLGGGTIDWTSFDAMLVVRSRGKRLLLGVETKYVEPFSSSRTLKESYKALTARSGSWFKNGTEGLAVQPSTNQLWRNLMLAQECALDLRIPAAVLVVAPRTNHHARQGVELMNSLLKSPERNLALVTLEDILQGAAATPELTRWAATFHQRYLDR